MNFIFALIASLPAVALLTIDSWMFPLPWPDDSAFVLTGVDWFQGTGSYRMLSQSPFVQSYARTNFNTMPALPFLTGILSELGVQALRGMRVPGAIAFGGFAAMIGWLRMRALSASGSIGPAGTAAKAESALWALLVVFWPTFRWGFGLIRPEVWVSLVLGLILVSASRTNPTDGRTDWEGWPLLSVALAVGAYFHFEAVYWVPAAAVAAMPTALPRARAWIRSLALIAGSVSLLLAPWLAYALFHRDDFVEQMVEQFGRLGSSASAPLDLRSWVDSVFVTVGNPTPVPKLFNPVKWAAFSGATVLLIATAFRMKRASRASRTAWLACFSAGVLAWRHPEMWFMTLFHSASFGLAALAFPSAQRWNRSRLASLSVALALSIGTAFVQLDQNRAAGATWSHYREFTRCLERNLQDVPGLGAIFEPELPDALSELALRRPDRNYFRHDDFKSPREVVLDFARSTDAVIDAGFNESFPPNWLTEAELGPSFFERPRCGSGGFWGIVRRKR